MYEKFYGLKAAPFRLSPDPSFFFGSKGHKRALAYLRYGVNQKEGFIVITGTPGTGKTTLARALLGEMGKSKTVVSELNTTHLQADDVLRMVAASYGLPHEDAPKSTLLKRLEEFLISRYRAGYHVLLIVDESQNLPKESLEELRMLSNFYLGKDALMQIFLLGQEQFREQMYLQDMEQLRQRVVASCHLDPLDQEETRQYIEHRLKVAGWQGDPSFSDRSFARIFSVTKGVPRRINTFCDRLLLFGALEGSHTFKDEEIKAVAKELSLETSPKDKTLSSINPANVDEAVSVETLDTEQLNDFSDEVTEVVPIKPDQDPLTMSQIVVDTGNEKNKSHSKISEPVDDFEPEPSALKAVSNGDGLEKPSKPALQPEKTQALVDSKPDWWELVALAIDYVSNPAAHKGITSSKNPLAKGITEFFEVGLGRKKIPSHMRTGVLENLTDETIKNAIRFYIKKVLLSSTADYYRRLGVERSASQAHIRTHYEYLFKIFQPDQEANPDDWDETYTRRINQAYGALRSEKKRLEYDDFLKSLDAKKAVSVKVLETGESSDSEAFIPPVAGEDEKKSNSPVVTTIVGLLLLLGAGAGYFIYQKQQSGDFDLMQAMKQWTAPFIGNSQQLSDVSEQVLEEGKAEPVPELELVEIPAFQSDVEITLDQPEEDAAVTVDPLIKQKAESSIELSEIKAPPKPEVSTAPKIEKPAEPKLAKKVEVEPVKKEVKPTVVPVKPKIIEEAPKTIQKVEAKPLKIVTPPKETVAKVNAPKPVVEKLVEQPKQVVKPKAVETLAKADSTLSSKPDAEAMSRTELNNFISEFTLSYEEGNIQQFMKLFTKDAATNDGTGADLIHEDYAALFDSTEMRVIDLKGLTWEIDGENATGNGGFIVTVLRKGGDSMRKFTGNIRLNVVKQGDALKLKGMFHSYGDE